MTDIIVLYLIFYLIAIQFIKLIHDIIQYPIEGVYEYYDIFIKKKYLNWLEPKLKKNIFSVIKPMIEFHILKQERKIINTWASCINPVLSYDCDLIDNIVYKKINYLLSANNSYMRFFNKNNKSEYDLYTISYHYACDMQCIVYRFDHIDPNINDSFIMIQYDEDFYKWLTLIHDTCNYVMRRVKTHIVDGRTTSEYIMFGYDASVRANILNNPDQSIIGSYLEDFYSDDGVVEENDISDDEVDEKNDTCGENDISDDEVDEENDTSDENELSDDDDTENEPSIDDEQSDDEVGEEIDTDDNLVDEKAQVMSGHVEDESDESDESDDSDNLIEVL